MSSLLFSGDTLPSSAELRARLDDLESAANAASADLARCTTNYQNSLRKAVATGDQTLSLASEDALNASTAAYARAQLAVATAQTLLVESVQRERDEAEGKSCTEIRRVLVEMAEVGRSADANLAALVGAVKHLKAVETELHQKVRSELGRIPWRSPSAHMGLRGVASVANEAVRAMLHDDEVKVRDVISEAVRDAALNIEGVLA